MVYECQTQGEKDRMRFTHVTAKAVEHALHLPSTLIVYETCCELSTRIYLPILLNSPCLARESMSGVVFSMLSCFEAHFCRA